MPPPQAVRIHERYALYAELASGGMATVHIGRLLGPVGFSRTVAIKRLRPQFAASHEFRKMFVDEARLAARVRHPNVVQTLDVVAHDRELFVVMDYVHGESLSRLLKTIVERRLALPSPQIVATILSGVLHGLHAAHEAKSDRGKPLGLIHRDVSPQNIIVGVDGVARVLDFGVAKGAGRLHTTQEGNIKGKIAYMAPEQIEGAPVQSTDIYASAVVLWEALTARRLFGGQGEAALVERIMAGTIDPPSVHRRSIPAALDALVLKGLARKPSARFSSAREMALELERCVGVVPASKVSAWVEALRGGELEERAAVIARIEDASSAPSDEFRAALLSETAQDARPPQKVPSHGPPAAHPASRGRAMRRDEPSSIAATSQVLPARSHRSTYLALGIASVVVGAASIALLRMPSSHGSYGLVSSPGAPAAPATAREVAPQDGLGAPPPGPAGRARGAMAGHGRPEQDTFAVIQAPDTWDPTPTPSSSCTPPFTVASDGKERIYKPGCPRPASSALPSSSAGAPPPLDLPALR